MKMVSVVSASKTEERFNLVKCFAFFSFGSIVAISLACAAFLSSYIKDHMLQRDALVSMQIINSIVQSQEAISYFDVKPNGEHHKDLEEFFRHISNLPDVIGSNVYASDRRVLWSSNPRIVGKVFNDNHELEAAFAGNLNTEIEIVASGDKQEHAYLSEKTDRFIENYLPIWNNEGTKVVGVVELYRVPEALLSAIADGQRVTWIGAALSSIFLFLTLFWIVWRGNRSLDRAYTRLMAAEKLSMIGEMAAAVAHGFRNPLASIRSSAELALDEENCQASRECLEDIVANSDRLEGWIGTFLLESQDPSKSRSQIQIGEAIIECVDGFSSQMRRSGIRVSLAQPTDPMLVTGNRSALRQVFNSIIANSIEAMPHGGELIVESALHRDTGTVDISFQDTGGGLKGDVATGTFQLFGTTKKNGMGVGLPIAQQILQRLGGDLHMTSREGVGTKVTIRLPAAA